MTKSNTSWDESWRAAVAYYAKLDPIYFRSILELASELTVAEEIAGLYAITSMTTLLISPYSMYPDWFIGRHVTIEPIRNAVTIRLFTSGYSPPQKELNCIYVEAKNTVLALCRELL